MLSATLWPRSVSRLPADEGLVPVPQRTQRVEGETVRRWPGGDRRVDGVVTGCEISACATPETAPGPSRAPGPGRGRRPPRPRIAPGLRGSLIRVLAVPPAQAVPERGQFDGVLPVDNLAQAH